MTLRGIPWQHLSIERLLPHAFCGGEGGRRPDEGAFGYRGIVAHGSRKERAYRISQRPPHPPSAPSPPEKARGEKALDLKESLRIVKALDVKVSLRIVRNTTQPAFLTLAEIPRQHLSIERLLPHAFCGGEGGRRPDEGAFDYRGIVAQGSREERAYCISQRPPHPPSAPSALKIAWVGGHRFQAQVQCLSPFATF